MGIHPIGALYRRYQPEVSFLYQSSLWTVNDVCQTVETFARTSHLDTNLTRLQRKMERLHRSSTTALSLSRYAFSSRQFVSCVEAKVPIKSLSKASACLAYELLHAG
jgi:hypothetical protein